MVHAEAWRQRNAQAARGTGPLWAVLGDSTAQAIGASGPDRGYVGEVAAWLSERDRTAWRIVNLSRSGATSANLVVEQLPALGQLPSHHLVSCAIGANDLLHHASSLETSLATIGAALPAGSLMANLPRGLRERRAVRVNRLITELVETHDLRLVDLWSVTGPPWRGKFAADWFHPNDTGYRAWADAFISALDDSGS